MAQPHHHLEHSHGHGHAGGHRALWLGAGAGMVHRIGRRQFLTDLGGGAFAIAVLGGVAACSSGDDADVATDATDATDAADPEATDAATAPPPTPAPEASGVAQTDGSALRWAQVGLGFVSAYVLVRGNAAAVVDTGSSGSADKIGEALGALGATFDDVEHVVLTHSHGDHIGSLSAVLDRSPSAAAYAGTLDLPNIEAPITVTGVGDGDDVFGLQVIDTPGHTPGSVSVLDPGIGLLVAGDALTGTDDGTGLSGPNEKFTADMAAAKESLAKLAGFDVEAIAMGHGQPVDSGGGSLLQSLATSL